MTLFSLNSIKKKVAYLAFLTLLSLATAAVTWAQCSGASNNLGDQMGSNCVYYPQMCDPNQYEVCEQDTCGGTCGSGYINFCVVWIYCGEYPGCNNMECI
jgi:hypothetical protein